MDGKAAALGESKGLRSRISFLSTGGLFYFSNIFVE
jgi:hypothetical protein